MPGWRQLSLSLMRSRVPRNAAATNTPCRAPGADLLNGRSRQPHLYDLGALDCPTWSRPRPPASRRERHRHLGAAERATSSEEDHTAGRVDVATQLPPTVPASARASGGEPPRRLMARRV